MTTPEAKVKVKVRAVLRANGAYFFSPIGSAYGRGGVPDIVACLNGRFIGIECKAGRGKTTPLQRANMREIMRSGGMALLIREDNIGDLQTCLSHVTTMPSGSGYGNFDPSEE